MRRNPFFMRHDSKRLAQLRRHLILDSAAEHAYDEIARVLATSLEVPITLINFMDDTRDWFKSAVGLTRGESRVDTSFCEEFFRSPDDLIVVNDTRLDDRFAKHPLVVGEPFIRFYASARITSAGQTLGTLCAYDIKPRKISVEQISTLQTLATAVMELVHQRGGKRLGADMAT